MHALRSRAMLRRLCALGIISLLSHPAQSQDVDATLGLFDRNWQDRNRCAEALLASNAPPLSRLIAIASGDATAEYRKRGIISTTRAGQMGRHRDWRIDLDAWYFGRFHSLISERASHRMFFSSLIAEAGIHSFVPNIPWSSQQLAVDCGQERG